MNTHQPDPREVMGSILKNPAQALSHELVMDAIDLSMELDRHLLLYGIEGLFKLETDEASWRLPPSRAAWIPAGTEVKATNIKPVRCLSLFFKTDFASIHIHECRIFGITALIREMIKHSLEWSIDRNPNDSQADRFFLTLLDLCHAEMQTSDLFTLPKGKSPESKVALEYTHQNLATPIRLEDAAKIASVSGRTLNRKLNSEIHMTWGQYLQQARMMKAMDCLAKGMTVTETSFDAGYTNIGAFSTAFQKYTELSPSQYKSQFD